MTDLTLIEKYINFFDMNPQEAQAFKEDFEEYKQKAIQKTREDLLKEIENFNPEISKCQIIQDYKYFLLNKLKQGGKQ